MTKSATGERTGDRLVYVMVEGLIRSGGRALGRGLLKLVRFQRRDQTPRVGNPPASNPQAPGGPFRLATAECFLLLFVPRDLKSRLVDDVTGGYGYSHLAVDLGEVDQPSGKPVMVESVPLQRVHRSFQDRYGRRAFARILLSPMGVDCAAFRECVLSKIGEAYDDLEALTWGAVDDPARQICSDLATVCLPSELQDAIGRRSRELGRRAASVHHQPGPAQDVFVSPNGFAKYFGAPRGERITRPDQLVLPRPAVGRTPPGSIRGSASRRWLFPGWVAVGILALLWLIILRWNRGKDAGHTGPILGYNNSRYLSP